MLARLLEEQETVLKGPNTPLTWEHLGEMELLHDCMRETLRMYPPLVGIVCSALFGDSLPVRCTWTVSLRDAR